MSGKEIRSQWKCEGCPTVNKACYMTCAVCGSPPPKSVIDAQSQLVKACKITNPGQDEFLRGGGKKSKRKTRRSRG